MLRNAAASWYFILLMGLLGGMAGWLFSLVRPPVYQASATVEYSVDYSRSAPLDDFVVHQAYERVRALMLADETLLSILDLASAMAEGDVSFTSVEDLRSQLQLSRYPGGFELVVYSQSPEQSALVANAWAGVALEETERAVWHAIRAAELQTILNKTGCKLIAKPGDEEKTVWECIWGDASIDPDELTDGLLHEIQQTRGILPIFTFSLLQEAQVPQNPVIWARGGFILVGVILGLVVGFLGFGYREV